MLSLLDEGAYLVNPERRIIFWNRAAETITGYPANIVVGMRCADNILRHVTPGGQELCLHGCPLAGSMADGKVREAEVYLHHKTGKRVPVVVRASPLLDRAGAVIGAVEIFADRSDRFAAMKDLERLRAEVLTDPQTRIGNRRYFDLIADSRFKEMERYSRPLGIIMADIDHFKLVNDTYGHPAGDRVLSMVAGTLQHGVRPLDSVVRWGGEEFVLLCPNVTPAPLAEIAERVRMLVERSWLDLEDGRRVSVTISLGAAMVVKGDSVESAVGRADALMYRAKEGGRNRVESEA